MKDWGYAALVEYGGRRILFDTGNHADIFEHSVKALQVDLTRLDAVVISHRHGDHTSGLTYLLKVNPGVTIYVPQEGAYFKGPLPRDFLARQSGLASEACSTSKAESRASGDSGLTLGERKLHYRRGNSRDPARVSRAQRSIRTSPARAT